MSAGQTIILASDRQRDLAKRLVDRAPPGAVLNVREATRTSDQNALMHALLSDVARARPGGRILNTDQWKCLFMDDLGFKPNWIPGLDGDTVVNTGYRSSRLTVAQMSDMIERIYAFGAEHGVAFKDPETRSQRAA